MRDITISTRLSQVGVQILATPTQDLLVQLAIRVQGWPPWIDRQHRWRGRGRRRSYGWRGYRRRGEDRRHRRGVSRLRRRRRGCLGARRGCLGGAKRLGERSALRQIAAGASFDQL